VSPRRRRSSFALAAAASLALAVLGADVFVLTSRTRTTPVVLGDVIDAYRSATTTSVVHDAPAVSATQTDGRFTRDAGAPATEAGPGPMKQQKPSTPTTILAPAFAPPAEGVYVYETTGGEWVSLAGAHHDYPARTYATVRRQSGCEWRLEQPIVKEHVDTRVFCNGPDRLLFASQVTTETFYGSTVTEEIRCDPPQIVLRAGDAPGSAREGVCRGADSEMRTRVTRLAASTLTVDGTPVAVERVLIEAVLTGRARGSSRVEQWWLPSSGLLVREARAVSTTAHQFGATIDYKERATFLLRSFAPQT
jgi:hypothetical protein